MVERRVEIRPAWAFRMPRLIGHDGVAVRRNGVLHRLVHVGDEPVVVRAAQPAAQQVVIGAEGASAQVCDRAIERMRFMLGVDESLRDFHERFKHDPLIGPAVRATPWVRPFRRPDPFEALAWAVTEQLIEYSRACEIQRRIVVRLGRRCARTGLRDLPTAATLAGQAPAQLAAFDLVGHRAITLVRAAREVASGRVDLLDPDHEAGWARLRKIPGVGSWTLEILALHGQGRFDQVPAGDLNFLKLVGRLQSGGDPYARATEEEVRAFFAPYAPYAGLAAVYASATRTRLRSAGVPRRAGTRSSGPSAGPLAA